MTILSARPTLPKQTATCGRGRPGFSTEDLDTQGERSSNRDLGRSSTSECPATANSVSSKKTAFVFIGLALDLSID